MKGLVVNKKVGEYRDSVNRNIRISKQFYEELDIKVASLISSAFRRAKANNRTTVLPRDLI